MTTCLACGWCGERITDGNLAAKTNSRSYYHPRCVNRDGGWEGVAYADLTHLWALAQLGKNKCSPLADVPAPAMCEIASLVIAALRPPLPQLATPHLTEWDWIVAAYSGMRAAIRARDDDYPELHLDAFFF
jgi:hypothetical protein